MPEGPAFLLHFADSELRGLHWQGARLELVFSAAQVSALPAARPAALGWVRGLVLALDGAVLAGDASAAFGRLQQGALLLDGRRHPTLAVPQAWAGPLQLHLVLARGEALDIGAGAMLARFDGAPDYRESLAC